MTNLEAHRIGTESIGRTCQSTVLTMISACGQKKILQPPQRITNFEVIRVGQEFDLLLIVGGDSVFYDTCFNFK